MNGDVKPDLVWRNTTTGQLYCWLMNGLSVSSTGYLYGGKVVDLQCLTVATETSCRWRRSKSKNEGDRVMKRWGDLKAFIRLIIIIFILPANMAMTGCAVTGTALMTAAYTGQANVVKDLLDKGADVNERGGCGFGWPSVTPLFCAAYGGHTEAGKVLVDRGADVNLRVIGGSTPLSTAIDMGNIDIAKLLIERDADVEYTMARYKEIGKLDRYDLLERITKKQQPPRYGASPPMLPTALPLPTEPAVPF